MNSHGRREPWKAQKRGALSLSAVCTLALALAGCGLVWWGISSPATSETVPARLSEQSASTLPRYETRKIRDMRTGHRVMADNPELSEAEVVSESVTPETHRNLVFRQTEPDGSLVEFELIRSLDWIERTGATVGGTVEIDLAEFGIEGPADVLDVQPCPQLENGPGRVVTGIFRRTSHNVIDVHIEGLDEPIGSTANHPFWSEDRRTFVAAGELRAGEAVLRADGWLGRVQHVNTTSRTEVVYNMEVDGEHVYYVSSAGVLVHNTCLTGVLNRHHGLPKFLGGHSKQILSRIDSAIHTEYHRLLSRNLKNAGIPLNVGGRGGSAADWARYLNANPGAQRKALDAVLDTSRAMDVKHGTNIVQDVWRNIMNGGFTPFP